MFYLLLLVIETSESKSFIEYTSITDQIHIYSIYCTVVEWCFIFFACNRDLRIQVFHRIHINYRSNSYPFHILYLSWMIFYLLLIVIDTSESKFSIEYRSITDQIHIHSIYCTRVEWCLSAFACNKGLRIHVFHGI